MNPVLISKALGRIVDGPHPTAIAIKTDLIDNLLFTFNCVSCLDYPWVCECTFMNPSPKSTYISEESIKRMLGSMMEDRILDIVITI